MAFEQTSFRFDSIIWYFNSSNFAHGSFAHSSLPRDSLQALPFHHAIAGGQLDAVKTLLPLYIKHGLFPGAGVVNEAMRGGISPLEIAIKKGHIDIASFLLQNGASVRNSPGLSSPMHWIAEVGGRFLNMGALELVRTNLPPSLTISD